MSPKLKAKCPHCHALLNVERPNEPRVAPCPRCNGDIRIPQDVVTEQTTARPRAANAIPAEPTAKPGAPSRNVLTIAGGIAGILAILYIFVVRGNGSELSDAMQKAHEINTMERAAQRDLDVEELKAKKARLQSEIESLRDRINATDNAIRAMLNQPGLSTSDIESSFEGQKS